MDERLGVIDRRLTLRYLQYRGGAVPEDLLREIVRAEDLLRETARPRVTWRLFDRRDDGSLAGTDFRPAGENVARLLRDCDQVILMAATLGAETEALLRRAQARDMALAVILDAAGSAAIEGVCDRLCAQLAERFAPRCLTDRYSPGYGDMPLSQQAELCRVLELDKRIGVTLSPGGLMLPQKSVTALLGAADRPQPRRATGCEACGNRDACQYRKVGTDCGQYRTAAP